MTIGPMPCFVFIFLEQMYLCPFVVDLLKNKNQSVRIHVSLHILNIVFIPVEEDADAGQRIRQSVTLL